MPRSFYGHNSLLYTVDSTAKVWMLHFPTAKPFTVTNELQEGQKNERPGRAGKQESSRECWGVQVGLNEASRQGLQDVKRRHFFCLMCECMNK